MLLSGQVSRTSCHCYAQGRSYRCREGREFTTALGPKSGLTGQWKMTSQLWNTIAGLPDPGQMRSFTLNYGSGSRRALNSSVASCFCVTSNRCDCGHPRSSRFCKRASSSRLGSRRPDDSISVRRWGAPNPTIWFMGAEPVKS